MLQSTGQNRYMTTGKTGVGIDTYSITPAARFTAAQMAVITAATGELSLVGTKDLQRFRGVILTPTIIGASTAGKYRIYGKRRGNGASPRSSGGATVDDFTLSLICYGTFTSSAAGVGVLDTAIVKTTEYIADVITTTAATGGADPVGPGSTINTALGSAGPQVFSPGTGAVEINMPAELWIPDVGNYESLILDGSSASTVVNWIWEGLV